MDDELKEVVSSLASKAKNGTANDALKYTQAALNLTHVCEIFNRKEFDKNKSA